MGHDRFQVGDLTAVIGDNSATSGHRAGYNGVWSLTHRGEGENLFVPSVAGLNLEHYFDGDKQDTETNKKIFFEPRHASMNFRKLSDREAELHQPPTPTFRVESWTRFTLVAPHYIDFRFRCKPTQHVFKHGYLGVFWASYINAPEDKSIYFRHGNLWQQLCTQRHNDESTVLHHDDQFALTFTPGLRDTLFKNVSPLRYDKSFYYGNFRNHVYLLMFDRTEGIRFTHSPSGGGVNAQKQATNPAWDFQLILPRYEVNQEYGFGARLVYRERCGRDEILREFEHWWKTSKK